MVQPQTTPPPTSDCQPELTERYLNWPQEFYVCEKHKRECFRGYENAILGPEDRCVICHPVDNDSMGG